MEFVVENNLTSPKELEFPYERTVHLKNCDFREDDVIKLKEFMKCEDFEFDYKWLTDDVLMLFLIARRFDIPRTCEKVKVAQTWRNSRKPHLIDSEPGWEDKMRAEGETGKIYVPGCDQWGRPVVVFDNTVENTYSIDDQMTYLAWKLEFAIRSMEDHVDKYTLFMKLEDFSIFNTPPIQSTMETCHMLSHCYPERVGHIVCYQPPMYFNGLYTVAKGFVDEKTFSKIIFISGDISEGSKNDCCMKQLIGENWKVLTGADQVREKPGCSPGYNHKSYWESFMSRLAVIKRKEQKE